jgi:AcrR family transcriptional regulator
MGARAESAARTREKVLAAATRCFSEQDYDAVSLKEIAAAAGVGLQTVVRTAGSKEALFAEVAERFLMDMMARFSGTALTDWRDALRAVLAFYERDGDRAMRVMAHEHRVPGVGLYIRRSRELQAAWIVAHHGQALEGLNESERKQRLAMVLTLTGGRCWYTLRRDHQLTQEQTYAALEEQLQAILDASTSP